MAKVRFDKLSKGYGDKWVVDSLILDTEDGEFIVLVGPSGCGKSTTLRMIAGLEEISDGAIYIGERRVNNVPPKYRDIAMVFQNYALYPHKNVFSNLAFGLRMRKERPEIIKTRVREVARTLGIENLLNRKPRQLSGGQRQRVAVGRAIVRKPSVFLMDEPLSNLDAQLRVSMRAELAKLHRELRVTTFYVTHDQVEALSLGERIVVMKDGRIQQISPPAVLYDSPANLFVARFIGSPAMNIVRCKLTSENRALQAEGVDVRLTETQINHLRSTSATELLLGVRSEDLQLVNTEDIQETNRIVGRVNLIEHLGASLEAEILLPCGEHFIVEMGRKAGVHIGDTVTLAVNTDNIHAFDVESERNLFAEASNT